MNEKLVKVENDDSLARDIKSQGIVNLNVNEYEKHIAIKKARKQKDTAITNEINNLKNDINEIKNLLKELIGK